MISNEQTKDIGEIVAKGGNWSQQGRNRIAEKHGAFRKFKDELAALDPDQIMFLVGEQIELEPSHQFLVRSPVEVHNSGYGTQIEIIELLYSVLHSKFNDLMILFFELSTPRGNVYFSTLAHCYDKGTAWMVMERNSTWFGSKLNRMQGPLNKIIDDISKILQSHYNGKVTYAGHGIVSLSGGMTNIADYVEKVKRFYKER